MCSMNTNPASPPDSPGGLGAFALGAIILDLRRPGDVMLVRRAMFGDWPIPDATRAALVKQLPAALAYHNLKTTRSTRKLIRLCQLGVSMEAQDLADETGKRSGIPGLPRRRRPEKRRPRHERTT